MRGAMISSSPPSCQSSYRFYGMYLRLLNLSTYHDAVLCTIHVIKAEDSTFLLRCRREGFKGLLLEL